MNLVTTPNIYLELTKFVIIVSSGRVLPIVTVSDHGVAAFRKLFRELKYLLCTVTSSLL